MWVVASLQLLSFVNMYIGIIFFYYLNCWINRKNNDAWNKMKSNRIWQASCFLRCVAPYVGPWSKMFTKSSYYLSFCLSASLGNKGLNKCVCLCKQTYTLEFIKPHTAPGENAVWVRRERKGGKTRLPIIFRLLYILWHPSASPAYTLVQLVRSHSETVKSSVSLH